MPDFNALASWLQDRYTEAVEAAKATNNSAVRWHPVTRGFTEEGDNPPFEYITVHVEAEKDWCAAEACCGSLAERQAVAAHIALWDPVAVLADLASKRALLADLMAEGHRSCSLGVVLYGPIIGECDCGRGERILRRLRILAAPFAGRADMPAELREA